jgi:putative phage-type endonuclease
MTPAERERRRGFLGASEVPAVCGLDPFKTALDVWAIKMGLIQEQGSIPGDMGNLFEAPLLSYYAAKHGRTLAKPGTLMHPVLTWAAATPDAVANAARNVQAKMVGRWMVDRWDDGAPDYVQAQVQQEMHVSGLAVTDVVACLGGTDYQEFEVARDEQVIGYIVEICARFWRDNIIGGQMPDIDGSEEARRVLSARFPRPTAGMGDAVPEFVEMAQRYNQITRATGTAQEEKDILGNAMRLAIGDSVGLKWQGGYASWKPNSAGHRVLRVQI